MADKFDPYRESLVMEEVTVWPEEFDDWQPADKQRVGKQLHEHPEEVNDLEYVRQHTGFCRRITVTVEYIERLSASS